MPLEVGVPLMVMVLDAQAAETPVGKPVVAPIPEAPVVAIVIAVNALLMHKVGLDEAVAAVLDATALTVIVASAAGVHVPVTRA